MHGVVIIDKPRGMTSAQVVAVARRKTKVKRIGHTGTLDPIATGVLPLCLGEATKLATHLIGADKGYQGEAQLGIETDTLDATGTVTRERPVAPAYASKLADIAAAFHGALEQIPPMYSAVKYEGKRLYMLARAGKTVTRPPRRVHIHSLSVVPLPDHRIRFEVFCSKGTYIRSLIADFGNQLGCGAHLTALSRTRVGRFSLEDATPLHLLDRNVCAAQLIPPPRAVAHMPQIPLPANVVKSIRNGQRLGWNKVSPDTPPNGTCGLVCPLGTLVALAEVRDARIHLLRVFTYT